MALRGTNWNAASPTQAMSALQAWVHCATLRASANFVGRVAMGHARIFAGVLALLLLGSSVGTVVNAAPIIVNGATFDAPASCQSAQTALVCKVDAQQLELWVTRKPMGAAIKPTDSFVRKMEYFTEQHQGAVVNILRSTSNDGFTQFSDYGGYSALGASMEGKGVVSSPTVRFASVLHDDEIWEFLEVVATRTAAIDALSTALRGSLVLPAAPVVQALVAVAAPEVAKKVAGSPLVATFSGKLLSVELPGYLDPDVLEDTTESLQVTFKHKTRPTAGPNLLISLRAPKDAQTTPASIVKQRKDAITATMLGPNQSLEISRLGEINGIGFALVGTPDKAKGWSGMESLETTFVANVGDRVLELRLTAEQQYASDARAVWSSIARSITLSK